MIDILCPVLGRSRNAQSLVDSVRANTTVEYDLHFLCSPGDNEQIDACLAAMTTSREHVWTMDFLPGPADYAKKNNHAYRVTTNPFLLLIGDDVEFQPGWDVYALKVAETGAGVVGLNDCANPHVQRGTFSTCPLVRRTYIDEQGGTFTDGPGIIFHEGYDHNYVDVELAEVARARRQWAFAKDAKVCHRHPSWKTAEDDSTYVKGRAHFHEDAQLFAARSRQWTRQTRRQRTRR